MIYIIFSFHRLIIPSFNILWILRVNLRSILDKIKQQKTLLQGLQETCFLTNLARESNKIVILGCEIFATTPRSTQKTSARPLVAQQNKQPQRQADNYFHEIGLFVSGQGRHVIAFI